MRAKLIRRASDPLFRRTMRYNNSSLFNWQTGGAQRRYICTVPRNRKENASADRDLHGSFRVLLIIIHFYRCKYANEYYEYSGFEVLS